MSNLLKEKCTLTSLRAKKRKNENIRVAKGSGTWPEIAGIRKKKGREDLLLKINLKYCQVE